ncbi:SxtJ family membrane protein [Candidatus Pelagibacter bacterium]|nr:SxtJ family membrane protein [Candidatus Pelagibacter bacterium]
MKPKSSNRSFGLLFFIVFIGLGLWPLTKSEDLNIYLVLISIFFLFFGILNSKILNPFNKIWIKFGEVLGLVIAPLVMAMIFFVILTPISLIVRISGKDLLGLKFTKNKGTYWTKRNKPINSMKKQF